MPDDSEKYQTWAIVEVMGHKKYAGYLCEQVVAGAAFVRVDVPKTERRDAYSKLIGPGSIYMITPCEERVARLAAEQLQYESPIPVHIPMPRQLPAATASADEPAVIDAEFVPAGIVALDEDEDGYDDDDTYDD